MNVQYGENVLYGICRDTFWQSQQAAKVKKIGINKGSLHEINDFLIQYGGGQ